MQVTKHTFLIVDNALPPLPSLITHHICNIVSTDIAIISRSIWLCQDDEQARPVLRMGRGLTPTVLNVAIGVRFLHVLLDMSATCDACTLGQRQETIIHALNLITVPLSAQQSFTNHHYCASRPTHARGGTCTTCYLNYNLHFTEQKRGRNHFACFLEQTCLQPKFKWLVAANYQLTPRNSSWEEKRKTHVASKVNQKTTGRFARQPCENSQLRTPTEKKKRSSEQSHTSRQRSSLRSPNLENGSCVAPKLVCLEKSGVDTETKTETPWTLRARFPDRLANAFRQLPSYILQ